MLGPLEVWAHNARTPLAGRWRALLAVLLANADRTVSVDRLLYELYGEQSPRSGGKLIQVYVSKLRRALGDADGRSLVTQPAGYRLRLDADEMDAVLFERLALQGRQALHAGLPDTAAGFLHDALAMWRGPAFADVPHSAAIQAASLRLEELRLATWEEWADAQLALGHHTEIIGELRLAVLEQPLRERLRSQLMLALARDGRRADALAEYVAGRRILIDELGVEPGSAMQALHAEILSNGLPGRQSLHVLPAHGEEPAGRPPCQLPRAVPDLVGRDAETQGVLQLLTGCTTQDGPAVVVITGQPGVGKSALAIQVAHRLRPEYHDGQFYIDLGATASGPEHLSDLLAGLLSGVGYPPAHLPEGAAQRAALWRAALADRRILLLLDNASNEQQVRLLLPGTPGSAALITSRSYLTGVEAVHRQRLTELTDATAVEMLARIIGEERVGAEPEAAVDIALLCGFLPLALRIAGARLAMHPEQTLARFATTLRPVGQRLDQLIAGDLNLREAIRLSEVDCDSRATRALHHLAMLDIADLPEWTLGPMLDLPEEASYEALDYLLERNLLSARPVGVSEPARYRLPELIAVYGRDRYEKSRTPVSAEEHRAALRRLCVNYLALIHTIKQRSSMSIEPPAGHAGPPPHLSERSVNAILADPHAWLEAERSTVVDLIERAGAAGLTEETVRLAVSLGPHFEAGGHLDDWRRSHEAALRAAQADDVPGVGAVLRQLGELHTVADRYPTAIEYFDTALAAFRGTGDRVGEAAAQSGLGYVYRLQGHYDDALRHLRLSARLAGTDERWAAVAYAKVQISAIHLEHGNHAVARRHLQGALAMADRSNFTPGIAAAQRCLGLTELAAGDLTRAEEHFRTSMEVCADIGDQLSRNHGRQWLGYVAALRGDQRLAAETLHECLAQYQGARQIFGQAITLRSLGVLDLRAGRLDQSLTHVREAMGLWEQIDSPFWTARTLDVLAQLHARRADSHRAASCAQRASRLRVRIGIPTNMGS
ncbi:AfsR/SARP family transcriptional regulator [Micromonospora polyrhachis]|uniref:DNA-binding SARP family transcriptional activator/tetratricopeptide (TPR) repeat protein n=1 Tax=Micromonospora polyrhachis TaxID=1282883 RepID=A0A7W7WP00_9ACTN|nr:BTAD domain-containing putative transcriptional regulator [Micromonospora polyrhachis]MBB4957723.1 DNA-binding SARP family transcriptional activator/tetratricopeptide (TPR) repeat protein [Micromonospora polyrhachis]